MKEHVLQLLEELVGAHSYGQKRAKADEIAALVKTAVFPADQVDEPDAKQTASSDPVAYRATHFTTAENTSIPQS